MNVWMPLYVGDYLADTTHLSAAEHGAYLLLIMAYWQSGRPLLDDDAKLARVARMSPKEWRAARETLAAFFILDGSEWRHGRVDDELAKAERVVEQKRNAGRASAERRAQRQTNDRSTDAAQPLQRKSNQSPPPLPTKTPESEHVSSDGAPSRTRTRTDHGIAWPVPDTPPEWAGLEAAQRGLPAELVHEVWQSWRDHRLAAGITPADPVADWRRWCGSERERRRAGLKPAGQTGESLADRARRITEATERRMGGEKR